MPIWKLNFCSRALRLSFFLSFLELFQCGFELSFIQCVRVCFVIYTRFLHVSSLLAQGFVNYLAKTPWRNLIHLYNLKRFCRSEPASKGKSM